MRCLQDVNNLSPIFQVKITLNKSKKEGAKFTKYDPARRSPDARSNR